MKFKLTNDWRDENQANGLFKRKTIEILPNQITCLVGCNGSGKTTVIEQLIQELESQGVQDISDTKEYNPMSGIFDVITKEEKKEPEAYLLSFDKNARFTPNEKGNAHDWFQENDIAHIFGSTLSTGEEVVNRLVGVIKAIKLLISKNKPFWLFLDDIDVGTSIDVILDMHQTLIEINKLEIEHYIVVSSNAFELIRGFNSIYVRDMSEHIFNDYEEYKKFVLKSRKDKDRRVGVADV